MTKSQSGTIWMLGEHRLMCGDSTNPDHVAKLMDGDRASVLFTSPPYWHQRDYDVGIEDWDTLMQGVFSVMPMAEDGQVLVNLGLIYRNHEWVEYYSDWLKWMSSEGWRRYGWYVWDKLAGAPGQFHGRLAPSHEWVFHFNEFHKIPKKTVEKRAASICINTHGTGLREKSGRMSGVCNREASLATHKIRDSVIRLSPEKTNGLARQHPAVFPPSLPMAMIEPWSDPGDIVYEPFAGSGSTILACERLGRRCRAMEVSPEYCDLAVARWSKETGRDGAMSK